MIRKQRSVYCPYIISCIIHYVLYLFDGIFEGKNASKKRVSSSLGWALYSLD